MKTRLRSVEWPLIIRRADYRPYRRLVARISPQWGSPAQAAEKCPALADAGNLHLFEEPRQYFPLHTWLRQFRVYSDFCMSVRDDSRNIGYVSCGS